MDALTSDIITFALNALVADIAQQVRFVPKYGGEVMCLEPSSDTRFVGGMFTYKDHVSLEFSQGNSLLDPGSHLEGKGKLRRHLKLHLLEDIERKSTKNFLAQTLLLTAVQQQHRRHPSGENPA
ncbi:DUF1801 domain-containing protein [Planktotalea arctica]|uniref:DUF1801 domain-containing protein n=1 Tax=Planktotalea arctica TaxID=1481893 RepID=UPI000A178481|nr:DUF1801 domain-containing protein [Planktotalea arctica]